MVYDESITLSVSWVRLVQIYIYIGFLQDADIWWDDRNLTVIIVFRFTFTRLIATVKIQAAKSKGEAFIFRQSRTLPLLTTTKLLYH